MAMVMPQFWRGTDWHKKVPFWTRVSVGSVFVDGKVVYSKNQCVWHHTVNQKDLF